VLGDRPVTIKAKLLALAVLLTFFAGTFYAGYLKGWYAHSEKVNSEHAAKNKRLRKLSLPGSRKRQRPAQKAK
jgi:hypothetical protein